MGHFSESRIGMGTKICQRKDYLVSFDRGCSSLHFEFARHRSSSSHPSQLCHYYPTMGDFEKAVDDISNKINKTMTDDELKEIYALYKQATVGDINVPRPGMLDFKGKAKWDAWNTKKGMAQDKAKEEYIAFSKKMLEKHGTRS